MLAWMHNIKKIKLVQRIWVKNDTLDIYWYFHLATSIYLTFIDTFINICFISNKTFLLAMLVAEFRENISKSKIELSKGNQCRLIFLLLLMLLKALDDSLEFIKIRNIMLFYKLIHSSLFCFDRFLYIFIQYSKIIICSYFQKISAFTEIYFKFDIISMKHSLFNDHIVILSNSMLFFCCRNYNFSTLRFQTNTNHVISK